MNCYVITLFQSFGCGLWWQSEFRLKTLVSRQGIGISCLPHPPPAMNCMYFPSLETGFRPTAFSGVRRFLRVFRNRADGGVADASVRMIDRWMRCPPLICLTQGNDADDSVGEVPCPSPQYIEIEPTSVCRRLSASAFPPLILMIVLSPFPL